MFFILLKNEYVKTLIGSVTSLLHVCRSVGLSKLPEMDRSYSSMLLTDYLRETPSWWKCRKISVSELLAHSLTGFRIGR